ncbi:uncharacterized protein LOC124613438 [Schistocerca americana]|uniref:uncharacterized protein LOC124613438 n=1 Tax=Schistocerca americana TaxID=7009 RepID=UPI001F4FCD41|nr:uncharacterized protein LOC124613438 [Schistocerca americana]
MKQKEKFEKLVVKVQKEDATVDPKQVMVNLSPEVAVSVLGKGLNFTTTLKRIPVEEIVSAVEAPLFCLPKVQAKEVRQDVSRVLRNSKPPKSNTLVQERKSLIELTRNKSIIVRKLDKGNATVILDTVDYHRKMEQLLADPVYRKLKCDPANTIIRKVKHLISVSRLDSSITKNLTP